MLTAILFAAASITRVYIINFNNDLWRNMTYRLLIFFWTYIEYHPNNDTLGRFKLAAVRSCFRLQEHERYCSSQ